MEISAILKQAETVSYVATALAVGAVYDHLITLDREIELVWKRTRWNVVQFLFLTSRYLSDAILIYGAISERHVNTLTFVTSYECSQFKQLTIMRLKVKSACRMQSTPASPNIFIDVERRFSSWTGGVSWLIGLVKESWFSECQVYTTINGA
ncbi:hypothetical protein D9613_012340 [Agrocybe pediades]|uniref:DUF6533 domain-containing protein n=1 Tax=Agrocybe pediades TaxID=84607 RepID=A0A8H4QEL9_9AGAR|nr:hypothetical protein D9613_012340 [Agrocybe pediades]